MRLIERLQSIIFKTSNREKIIRNVSWAVLGKIVNVLYGLFIGVLVARYLGPEQFGLMNYVISYVTIFSIIAAFGMDNIEVRELSKNPDKRDAIIGTAFFIRLLLSVVTILLIFITLLIFESDKYTFIMVMVYSAYLIASPLNVIRNYFTSIVLNEYVVKTEILRTFLAAGIKIVLLLLHTSLTWFIIANTFDFFFIAGGYIFAYRKKVGDLKKWYFNLATSKLLIRESFPLLLSGTAIIIYQKIDQVMIRNIINNDALGQFSVASRIVEMIIFIPSIIATTVAPILVADSHQNYDLYKLKRQQFMDIMIWMSVMMALITYLSAGFIINLLFGESYHEAITVLRIMAWKAVGISLLSASGQLIIIEGKQKYAVIRNAFGLLFCVILNIILIPKFGIIGAAWTTIISVVSAGYLSHYFIPSYRYLVKIQNKAMFVGPIRLIKRR